MTSQQTRLLEKAIGRHRAVVPLVVAACVAICEGSEGATEPTCNQENAAEPLVAGVAFTAVGQNRVQELEHEESPCREQLYEAPNC